MPKLNKYLLASLSLATLLAACGGSGSSSSPNDMKSNIPPVTHPTISVTNTLSSSKNIVAGQDFTITVISNDGATASINFANAKGTPNSIVYTPSSCNLAANETCSTNVHVNVTTPASPESASYGASVSFVNSNVQQLGNVVQFTVSQPNLIVLQQPESVINTQASTNTGFTIESDMIPNESGTATLNISSTNGLVGLVTLNPTTCSIKYDHKNIINNNCSTVKVNAGSQVGTTQISAATANFNSTTSNQIQISSNTNTPSVELISSLAGSQLYSGQSFTLTAQSVNGETGVLNFSTTDPRVTLSQASCNLPVNESCVVQVNTHLGLIGYHGVIVTMNSQPLGQYNFTVVQPQLAYSRIFNAGSAYKNSELYATFTIPNNQIPSESGQITVSISATDQNILTPTPNCIISYANNAITNNGCINIVAEVNNYGVSQLTASASGFASANSNSFVVPQNITYVLGINEIEMFGNTGNGVLVPIDNQTPITTSGGSTNMTLQTNDSGSFLYVTDNVANQVLGYQLFSQTGYPHPFVSSANPVTGVNPLGIVFSPSQTNAYALNYGANGSDSSISQYSVSSNGLPVFVNNISTSSNPVAIAINPQTGTVYVIGQNTLNTTTQLYVYQPQASNNNQLNNPQMISINLTSAAGVSVSPDGSVLAVATTNGIVSYSLNTDGSVNTATAANTSNASSNNLFNGITFAPYLVGTQNTSAAYASSGSNLYLFSFQGSNVPLSGWNNPIQSTGNASKKYSMAFTNIFGSQAYAYVSSFGQSVIGMFVQNTSNGQLTSNTATESNGTISSGVVPVAMVVGPNM